jgi:hypothetical protein
VYEYDLGGVSDSLREGHVQDQARNTHAVGEVGNEVVDFHLPALKLAIQPAVVWLVATPSR